MARCRLWLSVHEERYALGGPAALYYRDVTLEGTPAVEDEIELFVGDDSVMHGIKRRYWTHDGRLHLELRDIIRNASAAHESDWRGIGYPRTPMPWWPSDEETTPLLPALRAAGWILYSP